MLLFLLALVATPSLGGLMGSTRCQWGPAYWCANIPQAAECKAVSHCIKAVWEKETVPVDTDEVCDICKNMVGQARDTLESNETQEELKEVFDGSCDLIPIKLVATECRNIADQFVPELVETLASEMNPDTVCTVAGLCNSARIDAMLNSLDEQEEAGCDLCETKMADLQRQLRSIPDQQIEMKLLGACGYMSSYSDSCMYTVSSELKTIVPILREALSPKLCKVQGTCSAISLASQKSDDLQCEFCSKVVKHWIDVYASKASLEEFKEMLDGICDKVDSKNAAHCKHIVDDYYMPLFEFVRKLDPHMVCSFVGLCNNNNNKGFLAIDSTVPITTIFKLPKKSVSMVPLVEAQATRSSEKPTCVLCEYVISQLQTYLKDGQTEDEIKEFVNSICTKIPSALRGQCTKFVDTYEPLIVQLLVDEIEPAKICAEIKLCDANNMMLQQVSVSKGANCETCQFVMDEVFSVLTNKDDTEMVVNVLESVCYRLPTSIDMPCENFVDKYTPMILEVIAGSLTPDEVCRAIDLCQADEEDDEKDFPILQDTGCVLCEYVISNLDKMLSDKATEAEVKQALEDVCNILPGSVRKQCDQFVESYTDLIIQMLTGEITPEQVCTYLNLCKKYSGKIALPELEDTKGPYCTLCEYAITELDQMLKDSATEEEIEQALDVVCYQLSAPVHKECVKMVEKYTKEIVDMLVNDYTPSSVCQELSLCVNQEIRTNDLNAIDFIEEDDINAIDSMEEEDEINPMDAIKTLDQADSTEGLGCVMCEFALQVVDEHLDDAPTVDQVERVVQFMCSYLPGNIAEECEEFVDENGQKIIDAIIRDQLNPKQVCTLSLNLCDGKFAEKSAKCGFSPDMWCSTPFHAKLCDAEEFCKLTEYTRRNGPLPYTYLSKLG